jgi:hypothetical protein
MINYKFDKKYFSTPVVITPAKVSINFETSKLFFVFLPFTAYNDRKLYSKKFGVAFD